MQWPPPGGPLVFRNEQHPSRVHAAAYGFGETRVAPVALLTFTALSGSRSCGVVITKFSGHVVTLRSSPTVFADIRTPESNSFASYPAFSKRWAAERDIRACWCRLPR